MKIFSSFLCFTVVSCFLFSGCKKKSDPPPPPSKTDHLTGSSWKLETAGIDQDRNGTIDFSVMALISQCIIDNTIKFNSNNTGVTDEGATKCNAADPQTTPFNWNFANAEADINLTNSVLGQLNGQSKILELSATALSLTKDTVIGGVTTGLIVKLKH